jgi:hypothetical protein
MCFSSKKIKENLQIATFDPNHLEPSIMHFGKVFGRRKAKKYIQPIFRQNYSKVNNYTLVFLQCSNSKMKVCPIFKNSENLQE